MKRDETAIVLIAVLGAALVVAWYYFSSKHPAATGLSTGTGATQPQGVAQGNATGTPVAPTGPSSTSLVTLGSYPSASGVLPGTSIPASAAAIATFNALGLTAADVTLTPAQQAAMTAEQAQTAGYAAIVAAAKAKYQAGTLSRAAYLQILEQYD